MATATTVVGLVLGSVAITALSGSRFIPAEPDQAMAAVATTVAIPAAARVVTITGKDFSFDAPDVIPAGLTEFRFVNHGPSIHHVSIVKLNANKTLADLLQALSKPGPLPSWAKELGGPNAPAPGSSSNATLKLEPGNYALMCFVDLGGPPHFVKGMTRALRVVPAKAASGSLPKADATITLVDYSFRLSSPLRAGKRTIRVHNAGGQHHEVELVQLAPGATAEQLMKWLQSMQGPPPGKAVGGISGLESGLSESFSADLTPGKYVLICFLPDAKDGKPHFVHGMMQEISVN
jgi:hypothetical protein